jgi:outer membrane protein OmpA-like peptidoglycan-associated protein
MSCKLFIIACLGLTPLAACSSGPSAHRYDDVVAGKDQRVGIDERGDVLALCKVPQDRAYFDYDSTALDTRERAFLADVAKCMRDGPLAGRSILVTGYADETGAGTYNQDLAMARARVVADELLRQGAPRGRIFLRSQGEQKVVFHERERMDYDRRAELSLVELDL